MGITYGILKEFGLLGSLPQPSPGRYKTYDYKITEALRSKAEKIIRSNPDFVQYALKATGARYINDIMGRLIDFLIKANSTYYWAIANGQEGGE